VWADGGETTMSERCLDGSSAWKLWLLHGALEAKTSEEVAQDSLFSSSHCLSLSAAMFHVYVLVYAEEKFDER